MNNNTHIYDTCKDHMHAYVLAEMQDGTQMDGIITGLDDEYVYFAVPMENERNYTEDHGNMKEERQFGYGYPGYGYGPGYGHGFGYGHGYPRQRFRRVILPLAALAAISLLPWY